MRTIWGIIIFSALTILFNIVLCYCYMQGQRTAKKTKRTLSESHTNPAMTASEEQLESEQSPPLSESNNNNKSVAIDIEKPLPPVPEDPMPISEETKPSAPDDLPNESIDK